MGQLHKTLCRLFLILVVAGSATTVAFAEGDVDAGTVRIPSAFKVGTHAFDKGRYGVRVVSSADGPVIVLERDGSEVARDLAVVQERKGRARKASASATANPRDDGRIVVRVRSESSLLLLFLEAS